MHALVRMQHSRASQALSDAFKDRGFQSRLADRTKISQTRLSRLAEGGTDPSLDTALKLAGDRELPIDPRWWKQPALPSPRKRQKSRAA